MGKVYEALQRAEAERGRRGAAVVPGVSAPPVASASAACASAMRGRLARIWQPDPASSSRPARSTTPTRSTSAASRCCSRTPSSPSSSARCAARLDALAAERPMRTIAVTSAMPGEGKTTAALNLAIVTSMSLGRRVLLVDCDLRRPKVHAALGLRPECGLAEVLRGEATLDRAVLKVEGTNLEVLPVRGDAVESVGAARVRTACARWWRSWRAATTRSSSTRRRPSRSRTRRSMSELCDGIVFVVRADATPREDVAGGARRPRPPARPRRRAQRRRRRSRSATATDRAVQDSGEAIAQ